MQRCEEIFRQICWLEQRFWPEVDGMGEDDDGAQLGRTRMGPMGGNISNGMSNGSAINNNGHMGNQSINNGPVHGGRMNSNAMNSNMSNSGMGNSNVNGPIGPQMSRPSMNGPMMGGQGMSGPNMGGQGLSGSVMSGEDGTPGNDDGRNNSMFSNGGLEGQGP